MHVGAPCCGMNAVVRSFVRACMFQGFSVLGIHEGFDGLVNGIVSQNQSLLFDIQVHLCKVNVGRK